MLIINNMQKALLLEYLPEMQQHIDEGNIVEILEKLDDKITEIGFDADYELNEKGIILQKLYDNLYYRN